MSNLTNPELIRWIACPVCDGDLANSVEWLKCTRCGAEYKVRQGIPLLYPPSMSIDHLQEEENLSRMMKSQRLNPKEQFSSLQWNNSKQEFWSMVSANIQAPPKLFITIGCGYDSSFVKFEQQGYTFVNFDIVYDILDTLQRDCGAKSCVGGDVNKLPFKKNNFDYVISIDLIHHESERVFTLLESFRNLLKPGGILFLEDPNAWGMFQMAKSIWLPKPVYRSLRSTYHWFKRSTHRPADYEFPTSVWRVKAMLQCLGFQNIRIYPNTAYPCIGEWGFRFYKLFSNFEFIRRYHNYHYMLSATRQ
ncbi:MAG: methyltransferase domain-containing protein [Candidatus Eisenbacteria bacterium]|nr:methyltransferase domain-containing protein [Candidatus Eisenbacteria bacterium]